MALETPEDRHVWCTVPLDQPIEAMITGHPHTWYTHWHRGPGSKQSQAVRCRRFDTGACDWCAAGYERRVRYVMPVRIDGEARLLELGRVQYPSLACIGEMHGYPGTTIRLTRERPARNAPILVRYVHQSELPPDDQVDVADYVAGLGLAQLRMLEPEWTTAAERSNGGRPPRRER